MKAIYITIFVFLGCAIALLANIGREIFDDAHWLARIIAATLVGSVVVLYFLVTHSILSTL